MELSNSRNFLNSSNALFAWIHFHIVSHSESCRLKPGWFWGSRPKIMTNVPKVANFCHTMQPVQETRPCSTARRRWPEPLRPCTVVYVCKLHSELVLCRPLVQANITTEFELLMEIEGNPFLWKHFFFKLPAEQTDNYTASKANCWLPETWHCVTYFGTAHSWRGKSVKTETQI